MGNSEMARHKPFNCFQMPGQAMNFDCFAYVSQGTLPATSAFGRYS
jgi:hypothetical protein